MVAARSPWAKELYKLTRTVDILAEQVRAAPPCEEVLANLSGCQASWVAVVSNFTGSWVPKMRALGASVGGGIS